MDSKTAHHLTLHVTGQPTANAYVERYNRTVRYDWLNQQLFDCIEHIQEPTTQWLLTYNTERPDMAIVR